LFNRLGIVPLAVRPEASDTAHEAALLGAIEHQQQAHLFYDAAAVRQPDTVAI
jgi:hypothetical protein